MTDERGGTTVQVAGGRSLEADLEGRVADRDSFEGRGPTVRHGYVQARRHGTDPRALRG